MKKLQEKIDKISLGLVVSKKIRENIMISKIEKNISVKKKEIQEI